MKESKHVIDQIGMLCCQHRLTIVTAESCTGGGLTYEFTKSKICSPLVERGYIAYSNQSKKTILAVKSESIFLHGAVSEIVAREMAEGALKNSLAQVSLAITGLAGEDAVKNDVGIAWLGIAIIDSDTVTRRLEFHGDREKFLNYVIHEAILFLHHSIKRKFEILEL